METNWISISESKPSHWEKPRVKCLVFVGPVNPGRWFGECILWWNQEGECWEEEDGELPIDNLFKEDYGERVTHWMLMPKHPQA